MPTPPTEKSSANLKANLYEVDFYAWTQQQAKLLQGHEWNQLDLPNLIEEIASLGRKERQELRHRLSVLIAHLLKWQYQSSKRSRSCLNTIRVQRLDTWELLEENSSLQPYLEEVLAKTYLKATALAAGETNLPRKTFPPDCPYTLQEIISHNFYPGEPASEDVAKYEG